MTSFSCPSGVQLGLLGAFNLRQGRAPLSVPLPGQRLLAYLALQGHAVARRAAAAALWTDASDQHAAARLRSALWRMPAPDGAALVISAHGQLTLADHVDVDIRLARDRHRVGEIGIDELTCEVLPGWDEDWVDGERDRFRQTRMALLEQLSLRAQEAGDPDLALDAALAAVAAEPLRESAHRRVMAIHLDQCNPAQALMQYETCRRLLRDQLGLPPTSQTRAIVAHLLGRPLERIASTSG